MHFIRQIKYCLVTQFIQSQNIKILEQFEIIALVAQSEERQSHNLKVESSNLPQSSFFCCIPDYLDITF